MVLVILYYSVPAFVFAGHRLPLGIFVVADRWRIGGSEALAPTLRYTAAGH